MISLPVAAHNDFFKWQLDLFWYCHRRVYGEEDASKKIHAIVARRNDFWAKAVEHMEWNIDVPHTMCDAFFDAAPPMTNLSLMNTKMMLALPLNIQFGLSQVINKFNDDEILEVLDCDMLHFRPAPVIDLPPDLLLVSTVYENWHLFSLSSNRHVIEPYFENNGKYYNGGFVPIIGRASTFKRILFEWTAVHIHILTRAVDDNILWWAGMFALQAACEKKRVQMVAMDSCFIPLANTLTPHQYIAHYAVDSVFNKRTYPRIDFSGFDLTNPYYRLVKDWMEQPAGTDHLALDVSRALSG